MPVSKVRKNKHKRKRQDKPQKDVVQIFQESIDYFVQYVNPKYIEINDINTAKVKSWGNIDFSVFKFAACTKQWKIRAGEELLKRLLTAIALTVLFEIEDDFESDMSTVLPYYTQLLYTYYEVEEVMYKMPENRRVDNDICLEIKMIDEFI